MPLYFLQKHGWNVTWGFLKDVLDGFAAQGEQFWINYMNAHDIVILPRYFIVEGYEQYLEGFFELFRAFDKKIVYETDDDYTNLHRQAARGDAMALARVCDAVTVTTPFLADLMSQHTGLPCYALPNLLDPAVWKHGITRRKVSEDKIIIGLSGTQTHERDWKVLETVLPRIIEKHPNVALAMAGFHPPYLQGLDNTEYLIGFPYEMYATYVRQCDIVLAAVDPDDGFNMYKSPIKAVEGIGATRMIQNQFCGAAVIATDNPVYRLAIRHEDNGLLAPYDADAWYQALDKLISDANYRRNLQQRAYKSAWKEWDITKHWHLWAKAYTQIAKQPTRSPIMAKGVPQ